MAWIVSAVLLILVFNYLGSRVEAARLRKAGDHDGVANAAPERVQVVSRL